MKIVYSLKRKTDEAKKNVCKNPPLCFSSHPKKFYFPPS